MAKSDFALEVSTNLQNMPKKAAMQEPHYDVRRCLVPMPGYALVEGDLSQAEARIVAACCNDRELLAKWADPAFDVHTWTAAHILEKGESNVNKVERHVNGKTPRHALSYGMGHVRLRADVNADADLTGISIDASTARRVYDGYHRLTPALQGWWRRVESRLRKSGQITTCFGRRRTFFGRRSGDGWLDSVHKEAIAYEPQSTIADLLNWGLLKWWKQHRQVAAPMMQVHDSIILHVKQAKVAAVARLLRRCMQTPITVNRIELLVPADLSYSMHSLGEMQEMEL